MKNLMTAMLVFMLLISSAMAQEKKRWVEIGVGTYDYGFLYPYKVRLSIPFGVRNIEDIKQGLLPMKFDLQWLLMSYSQEEVKKLFLAQLEEGYTNKESFLLAQNIIQYFLGKLPATKKHDEWTFIYYPDEGSKLFIEGKKVHHLVGAEFNRALMNSWIEKSPVLTANLFNRLLKLQKK